MIYIDLSVLIFLCNLLSFIKKPVNGFQQCHKQVLFFYECSKALSETRGIRFISIFIVHYQDVLF